MASRSGCERDGALAVVTFDSPPLNLMDRPLLDGLLAVVDQLESEPARGVLFRAEGRAVSGGVDVSMFAAMDGPEAAQRTFDELIELARRVDRLPCPTVFAAHALCLTWAFELALACDLILAAESASFGLVERVIGLTPAMGGTQRLAERAGTGRARQFVMEGRAFAAAELERWNVVNLVLADHGLRRCRAVLRGRSWPTGRRWRMPPPSRCSATIWRAGWSSPTIGSATVAGRLFATEDLQSAVRSFLPTGRVAPRSTAADAP